MSYFGNTMIPEVEAACASLAEALTHGEYDEHVLRPLVVKAMHELFEMYAYMGCIRSPTDYDKLRAMLGVPPRHTIPGVVIQDNRDKKGRFAKRVHSDRSAQPSPSDWLDDDNIDKLKK